MAIIGGIGVGLQTYALYEQYQQNRRDRNEAEDARIREQAALQRRYEAEMISWQRGEETLDKWSKFWKDLYASPEKHPEFGTFKATIEEQAESTRQTLADTLRRRGITGGAQTRAVQDVAATTEKTLADALINIKMGAQQRELEVESKRQGKPWLGGPEYRGYDPGTFTQITSPDLSGLGSYLALMQEDQPPKVTSDTPPGGISSLSTGGTQLQLPEEQFSWMYQPYWNQNQPNLGWE